MLAILNPKGKITLKSLSKRTKYACKKLFSTVFAALLSVPELDFLLHFYQRSNI